MNNHEIKQRIAYLVEHGGITEDPLDDVRHWAKLAVVLSSCALLVDVVLIALALR